MKLRVILLTLTGVFFITMSSGIRNNYGIMLSSIIEHSGIPLTGVSFIFAVGQLVYGLVQPFFGILAAKKGSKYALASGVIIITIGLILTPFSTSMLSLLLCLGIILPTGAGVLSYGIIIGAISPKIPPSMILTISGIINASIGLGNLVMSPVINSLITTGGLRYGLHFLSVPVLLTLPIALLLGRKDKNTILRTSEYPLEISDPGNIKKLFTDALRNKTYRLLVIGFFCCGFHMALINNHLPNLFLSEGFSSDSAARAFSLYGISTIIGSVSSGILCNKFKMQKVLGVMYGLRPFTILALLLMPKTVLNLTVFTCLLGFTGATTVPPVSGLINKTFGTASISMLFGLIFFIHQVGGFTSAWLGGICYELTGAYTAIWAAGILLGTTACIASFSIKS
ncbi:MAG: MFS transporter [Treponema sp.]|nr:MFS transporter [Treponema sp.]